MQHADQGADQDKRHAHDLLDRLPPEQFTAIVRLLETMLPEGEEERLSDGDRQAIADAEEWMRRNPPIPHEEVLADLGLTPADWERMAGEPDRRR